MKKLLILCSAIFMLFGTSAYAAVYSDWAEESVKEAQAAGILSTEQMSYDFTKPITRSDIAMLTVKAYINATGYSMGDIESHFTDTKNPYAEAAFQIGILYGTSDTEFTPHNNTTRQEMAKIILSLRSVINGEEEILPNDPVTSFTDFDTISDWAKPYVAKAASDGIINGYPDGSFGGSINISWEQAISLITRCAELNVRDEIETVEIPKEVHVSEFVAAPAREINLSQWIGAVVHGAVRLKWTAPVTNTTVTVTIERNSYYPEDRQPLTQSYQATGFLDLMLHPNRKYTISVAGGPSQTFNTSKVTPVNYSTLKAAYPQSQGEAEPLMVSVTVPVWRMSGGTKVSSTATFKIHQMIAEEVKLVFEEIYNGAEQFPIKDVGGYAWRGGRSEHNGGTAIDINWDENYCVYNNGTTIGKYWKPYEDIYSIPPHGDVVNAFERHGFTWGGDSWRNPKDYMHFSYLGT